MTLAYLSKPNLFGLAFKAHPGLAPVGLCHSGPPSSVTLDTAALEVLVPKEACSCWDTGASAFDQREEVAQRRTRGTGWALAAPL